MAPPFNLIFELPVELRLRIYNFVLPHQMLPSQYLHVGLLYTCRLLRNELKPEIVKATRRHIEWLSGDKDDPAFHDAQVTRPSSYSDMRYLTIELTINSHDCGDMLFTQIMSIVRESLDTAIIQLRCKSLVAEPARRPMIGTYWLLDQIIKVFRYHGDISIHTFVYDWSQTSFEEDGDDMLDQDVSNTHLGITWHVRISRDDSGRQTALRVFRIGPIDSHPTVSQERWKESERQEQMRQYQ